MLTVCYSAKGGQGCSTTATLLALVHKPATIIDLGGGDIPYILGLPGQSGDGPGLTDFLTQSTGLDLAELPVTTVAEGVGFVTAGTVAVDDVPQHRWAELAAQLDDSPQRWIIDVATTDLLAGIGEQLLITRHCYLALRRALHHGRCPTKVITIREPGRALSDHDVERVIGAPVEAHLDLNAEIANDPRRAPVALIDAAIATLTSGALTVAVDVDAAVARSVDAGLLSLHRLPTSVTRALARMTR
jgi:hypothetical protein